MKPLRILFVDDERSILDGLRRATRHWDQEWSFLFSDSGREAMALMEQSPVEVLITDMRMPEMDGIALLREVRRRFPETIRFILSGYSDREMILDSVGLCHQFFSKPCDVSYLREAIVHLHSLYRMLNRNSTQAILGSLRRLPTPPIIYQRITHELNRPEPSIENLSNIIRCDAAMSIKVLQIVNSAFFGMGFPVTDAREAVAYLGTENLKAIAMVVGLAQEGFPGLQTSLDLNAFTQHSLLVGSLAKLIAGEMGYDRKGRETAFTAGLMHDIGKLVMASHFDSDYYKDKTFGTFLLDSEATQDEEMRRFGENHATLGAALLALWGIPPAIVLAVAYHHKPMLDGQQSLSYAGLVHIANAIALHPQDQPADSMLEAGIIDSSYLQAHNLTEQVKHWTSNLRNYEP